MQSTARAFFVLICVAAVTVGFGWLMTAKPGPAATHAGPAADEAPAVFDLSWHGLEGRASAGGPIGDDAGEAEGFAVGGFIVAHPSLVITARAGVGDDGAGGDAGEAACLYASRRKPGLGVGSRADAARRGSAAISGGGGHGSEVVRLVFHGDARLAEPRYVEPESVVLRLADYRADAADCAVALHPVAGPPIVYPPHAVEPVLVEVDDDTYELRVADLPGVEALDPLRRVDVRSGWPDAATGALSGGHFWLERVTLVTMSRRPVPNEQYD